MVEAAHFFRRFRVPDTAAVLLEIEEDEASLARAAETNDEAAEMMLRMRLGFDLVALDREAEASGHLLRALSLSRKLADRAREIEILLHLGTARQYLGERVEALALFQEGLQKAETSSIPDQVHFLLHHKGRCEVEMNRMADARLSFGQALRLREKIGSPRLVDSTRAALKDIEGL
jgi:tetratricopeptide (TPR) repeat protein